MRKGKRWNRSTLSDFIGPSPCPPFLCSACRLHSCSACVQRRKGSCHETPRRSARGVRCLESPGAYARTLPDADEKGQQSARAEEVIAGQRLKGRHGRWVVEGAFGVVGLGCSVDTSRWDEGGIRAASAVQTGLGKKSRMDLDQQDMGCTSLPVHQTQKGLFGETEWRGGLWCGGDAGGGRRRP